VHIDTTMVGTAFTQRMTPLPADWPARLVDVADRVVFGTDFPNIPYGVAEQVAAVAGWAAADDRLGAPFVRAVLHDNPARLLGVG
jgi:predicted TIM-barrel fold metal-dependent hydrolase